MTMNPAPSVLDAVFAAADEIDAANAEAGIIDPVPSRTPAYPAPATGDLIALTTTEDRQFLALYAIVSAARWPLDSPCRPMVDRLAQLGLVEFTDVDTLYSRITDRGAELLSLTGIV